MYNQPFGTGMDPNFQRGMPHPQELIQNQCQCGKNFPSYSDFYLHVKLAHPPNYCCLDENRIRDLAEKARKQEAASNSQYLPDLSISFKKNDGTSSTDAGHHGRYSPLDGFPMMVESVTNAIIFHPLYYRMQVYLRFEDQEKLKPADQLTCDEILVRYLCDQAAVVDSKLYRIVVNFVVNYRDCFNAHGGKFLKDKVSSYEEENERTEDLCMIYDAQWLPLISEIFLNDYIKKFMNNFDRGLAAELSKHLCDWLQLKKFTNCAILIDIQSRRLGTHGSDSRPLRGDGER